MESPQKSSSITRSRRRRRESKSQEDIVMQPEPEVEIHKQDAATLDKLPVPKKKKKSKEEKQHSKNTESEDHNDELAEKLSSLMDNVKVKKKKSSDNSTQREKIAKEIEKSIINAGSNSDQEFDKSTAAPEDSTDPPKKEKKRKQKNKKSTSKLSLLSGSKDDICISSQLRDLKDDIVNMDETNMPEETILNAQNLYMNPSTVQHEKYINATFHENVNGFVTAKNNSGGNLHDVESMQDLSHAQSRTSHAVFLQGGFRAVSVFCHGLLAGVSLTHCLLIFMLSSGSKELIAIYQPSLAHTFFSLIFALTIICFVASCDSSNVCSSSFISVNGLNIPWIPGLYLASLVISVINIRVEDIFTHNDLIKDDNDLQKQVSGLISWWRWMCLSRSVFLLLGWLAVVPNPHGDQLLQVLQHSSR